MVPLPSGMPRTTTAHCRASLGLDGRDARPSIAAPFDFAQGGSPAVQRSNARSFRHAAIGSEPSELLPRLRDQLVSRIPQYVHCLRGHFFPHQHVVGVKGRDRENRHATLSQRNEERRQNSG